MRNVFLEVFFKKLSIVTADLDERCASEPKQTTSALADSSSHCVVHPKKSHATDFLMVKFGWPVEVIVLEICRAQTKFLHRATCFPPQVVIAHPTRYDALISEHGRHVREIGRGATQDLS